MAEYDITQWCQRSQCRIVAPYLNMTPFDDAMLHYTTPPKYDVTCDVDAAMQCLTVASYQTCLFLA